LGAAKIGLFWGLTSVDLTRIINSSPTLFCIKSPEKSEKKMHKKTPLF